MIYVHFLVARFQKMMLLIVQYLSFSTNLVRATRYSRIWSSTQDYAVLFLLLNMLGLFISVRLKWSGGNNLYQLGTGWRRLKGCLKRQVPFGKKAINYRALLRKMTYKDKASFGSTPPCTSSWKGKSAGMALKYICMMHRVRRYITMRVAKMHRMP